MEEQDVLLEKDDKGIAVMTLNRPDRLNALDTHMQDESLPQTFLRVATDYDIKALIITGAGRGFCSGADVKERLQAHAKGTIKLSRKNLEEALGSFTIPLYEIAKPVIAAINGPAVGVGLSIALLCDFRIASEKATFGAAFIRRGLMPDGGITFLLPHVVGLPKALELMMTGDIIDAREAERIGMVNKVVPHDMLMAEARALAEKLASGPLIALSFTKRAAYHGLLHNLREQLQFESWGQSVCRRTEDFKEGVTSFLEKRPPNFQGR